MTKKQYVLIEGLKGTRINRSFDSWLCPWDDFLGVIENMMNSNPVSCVRLTDLEFTEEELEAYCKANEIAWDSR